MRDLFLFAPRGPRTSRPRNQRPPRRRFGGRWLQGDARPPPPPVGGAGERGPRKSDGPGGAPPPPRPGCSCACELPRRRVPAGEGRAPAGRQPPRRSVGQGLLLRDLCIWLLVQPYCIVILKLCQCGSKFMTPAGLLQDTSIIRPLSLGNGQPASSAIIPVRGEISVTSVGHKNLIPSANWKAFPVKVASHTKAAELSTTSSWQTARPVPGPSPAQ
uniref:uncharacterized protein LOC118549894 n=1 Tax=Halichoerus grypus TaxID=9711 RepID=UPI0016592A76|nr:uncharacterized protein LOC118549894 [Halichoerus grypus]